MALESTGGSSNPFVILNDQIAESLRSGSLAKTREQIEAFFKLIDDEIKESLTSGSLAGVRQQIQAFDAQIATSLASGSLAGVREQILGAVRTLDAQIAESLRSGSLAGVREQIRAAGSAIAGLVEGTVAARARGTTPPPEPLRNPREPAPTGGSTTYPWETQYDSGITAAQRAQPTTYFDPIPGTQQVGIGSTQQGDVTPVGDGGTGVAPSPGADSGTGSGSTGMDAGSAGTTSGTTTSPVQVPGGGELWRVDNGYWLIYTVPGTTPPVPMAWRVGDPARIGNPPVVKTMTTQEFQEAGALDFGSISEINNTSAHPFESFLNEYETEAGVKPWLWDPEIMALNAMAVLEGRAVTESELQQTEWWRTHSREEREWLEHVSRDPRTAAREVEDAVNALRGNLIKMGVEGVPEAAIRYIVNQSLTGKWSGAYSTQQINKLADPYVAVDMDAGLQEALAGVELNTLADNVETVRTEVAKWLGPAFAKGWTESQLRDWAGRVRNNDTALEELRTTLRQQRLALFPEYANPDLSYQDIAAPWREVWAQSWGQQADEYDPLFNRIIRTNDLGEASKMLRREGLNRGVGAVVDQALIGIQSAFGGQVRNPL